MTFIPWPDRERVIDGLSEAVDAKLGITEQGLFTMFTAVDDPVNPCCVMVTFYVEDEAAERSWEEYDFICLGDDDVPIDEKWQTLVTQIVQYVDRRCPLLISPPL